MASFDPDHMTASAAYKLLAGCVVPRPIAWVATRSTADVDNLAPFSFFSVVSRMPPMLSITIEPREDGCVADTLVNLRATGELVVNMVSRSQVDAMHLSSTPFPPEVDEFEAVGLGKAVSDVVRPMRILGAPASMECVVEHVLPMGDVGGHLVIVRVVRFHVEDRLMLERGRVDVDAMQAVGRLAGAYTLIDQSYSPVPTVHKAVS